MDLGTGQLLLESPVIPPVLDPFLPVAATQRPQEHRAWGPAGSGHGPRSSLTACSLWRCLQVVHPLGATCSHHTGLLPLKWYQRACQARPNLLCSLHLLSPQRPLLSPQPPLRTCNRLAYTCLSGGWAQGSGRGGGQTSGLPRPPVSGRWSTSGCHMTVVGAAAGTAACAKGHGTSAVCVNVLGPPRGVQAHLHGAAATGREPGLDGCA